MDYKSPWFIGIVVLLVCSVFYGVNQDNRKMEILKVAMENGYEPRENGSVLTPSTTWVRVRCKRCEGTNFERVVSNVVPNVATEAVKVEGEQP